MPVASSSEVVVSLFDTFWGVLAGPGAYILGGLLTVSIIFFAYNKLSKKLR